MGFDNACSSELHTPATTANFLSLLVSPITSYVSVLTLLAIPSYIPLLSIQSFATRASIGQAVVASVLKNGTIMETAEDVSGVLGLCAVLVKDQKDLGSTPQHPGANLTQQGPGQMGRVQRTNTQSQGNSMAHDLAEEQGWLARMVHLFRSDDLGTQFNVRLPSGAGLSRLVVPLMVVTILGAAFTGRTENSRRGRPENPLHFPTTHHMWHQVG